MSPLVTYLGPTSRQDGTEEVHIDDKVLVKGGEGVELTKDQLKRVQDLSGLRFEVGEGKAKEDGN